MQRRFQIEALANDGHERVNGHSDPHLGLDRVLGGADETLDAQVLLGPAKKQFDLPSTLVKGADSERGQSVSYWSGRLPTAFCYPDLAIEERNGRASHCV